MPQRYSPASRGVGKSANSLVLMFIRVVNDVNIVPVVQLPGSDIVLPGGSASKVE